MVFYQENDGEGGTWNGWASGRMKTDDCRIDGANHADAVEYKTLSPGYTEVSQTLLEMFGNVFMETMNVRSGSM